MARTRRWIRRGLAATTFAGTLALAASQGGCLLAAAAAGTGATVAYMRGDTELVIDADVKRTAAAAERAVQELDLSVLRAESTGLDGRLEARSADNTKINISLKGETDTTCRMWVRVGAFGNTTVQQRIIDRVKAHLAAEAAADISQ